MHKNKEQQMILRIALYILMKNGHSAPNKRQVLNFIKFRKLLQIREDEDVPRNETHNEMVWEHQLAWQKQDLIDEEEMDSPEHDCWKLTRKGIKYLEDRKELWLKYEDSEQAEELLIECPRFTADTISWMLKIGKGASLTLKK